MDLEQHATEVTVSGIVEDRKAAEALMNEMSKDLITGKPMGKARAKGKGKQKAINVTPPGTPTAAEEGQYGSWVEWAVYSTPEAYQKHQRLACEEVEFKRRGLAARFGCFDRKAGEGQVRCEAIVTSVVPAAAEVVDAALEAKAALFIELKGDETFLAERLKRLNKAAA